MVGTITDIADGRVFGVGTTRDVEPVFLKLTYTVKVEKVLAGDESLIRNGLVYVEIFRTKYLTVKSFQDATLKNQRLLLFLNDYSRGFTSGTFKLIEKSPSIPDGAPVLAPYTEGFLIEDVPTGRLRGGLEDLRLLSTAWNEGINSIDNFVATHFAGNELIE